MTTSNPWGMKCPDCGSGHLQVGGFAIFHVEESGARLVDDTDIVSSDGDEAMCDCGWEGTVGERKGLPPPRSPAASGPPRIEYPSFYVELAVDKASITPRVLELSAQVNSTLQELEQLIARSPMSNPAIRSAWEQFCGLVKMERPS